MKELDDLKNYIIKCCYWYYVKSSPLISDPEFDKLFKKLQYLEKLYGTTSDSPTQIIYGDQESQYQKFTSVLDSDSTIAQKFSTAKIVISWTCNMVCSYCCNKLEEVRKSFKSICQSELKVLPHLDFELTGGEVTIPQNFSILCEILSNWMPENRNYYVYTNGVWLDEWHAELLRTRKVKGINVGVHIGEIYNWNFQTTLKNLDWERLINIHEIIPIRLWVREGKVQKYMEDFPFQIRVWKLGECDNITTDRYYLK